MKDEAMQKAQDIGDRAVLAVCAIVDANEPERATIARIEAIVRHGYKFINLHIRKDGQEYGFEADWLARLFRELKTPGATVDVVAWLETENARLRATNDALRARLQAMREHEAEHPATWAEQNRRMS